MDPSAGELAVSHELDVLNHRFQALLNMLIDQLTNLASVNPDDLELQVRKIIQLLYFYVSLVMFDFRKIFTLKYLSNVF